MTLASDAVLPPNRPGAWSCRSSWRLWIVVSADLRRLRQQWPELGLHSSMCQKGTECERWRMWTYQFSEAGVSRAIQSESRNGTERQTKRAQRTSVETNVDIKSWEWSGLQWNRSVLVSTSGRSVGCVVDEEKTMDGGSAREQSLFTHCLVDTLTGAVVVHRRSCWCPREGVKQTVVRFACERWQERREQGNRV
jgi:hypothetical protein